MAVSKIKTGIHAGEWQARIQPRDKATGDRIFVQAQYAPTKSEAKLLEAKMLAEIEAGMTYREAGKPFVESFDRFIAEENALGRWEESTHKDWLRSSSVFHRYLGNLKIRDINEAVVRKFARQYVDEHKVTTGRDSVIGRRLAHMRAFFKPLVGESVKKNPVPERATEIFFRTGEKKADRERYILNADDRLRMTEVLIDRSNLPAKQKVASLAVWVTLKIGARPQEIQALKWQNLVVKDGLGYFVIDDAWNDKGKKLNGHLKSRRIGDSRTTLSLSPALTDALLKFKDEQTEVFAEYGFENKNDFIFVTLHDYRSAAYGYPISQTSLNEAVKRIGKEAGIEPPEDKAWSMYSLRHSVATLLGNTPGMSYPWAAASLGHTLEEFMQTYVHVDEDRTQSLMQRWADQS
jgi:integrase